LTLEGAIGAVIVFVLMALTLRRPIFWFRVVAAVVLLVSYLPDVALGLGGGTAMMGMRAMGPFLGLQQLVEGPPRGGPPGGGPAGGRPPGGGPPGGFVFPAMPLEQVLILILLHTVTAVVCVVLLTTLTRVREPASEAVPTS